MVKKGKGIHLAVARQHESLRVDKRLINKSQNSDLFYVKLLALTLELRMKPRKNPLGSNLIPVPLNGLLYELLIIIVGVLYNSNTELRPV